MPSLLHKQIITGNSSILEMLKDLPVVFVPAYNEANNIGKTVRNLKQLQKQGLIGKILVIDDGSADQTAKIAKREGADTVIRFSKNHGKAMAFFEAVRHFDRSARPPKTMIMLDADLVRINGSQIKKLIKPLGEQTSAEYNNYEKWNPAWKQRMGRERKFRTDMAIGTVVSDNTELSGERAFVFSSLKPIIVREDIQRMLLGTVTPVGTERGGYALEKFLNDYFTVNSFQDQWKREHLRYRAVNTEFKAGPITGSDGRRGIIDKIRLDNEPARYRKKREQRVLLADLANEKLGKLRNSVMQTKHTLDYMKSFSPPKPHHINEIPVYENKLKTAKNEKSEFIRKYLSAKSAERKLHRKIDPRIPLPRKRII